MKTDKNQKYIDLYHQCINENFEIPDGLSRKLKEINFPPNKYPPQKEVDKLKLLVRNFLEIDSVKIKLPTFPITVNLELVWEGDEELYFDVVDVTIDKKSYLFKLDEYLRHEVKEHIEDSIQNGTYDVIENTKEYINIQKLLKKITDTADKLHSKYVNFDFHLDIYDKVRN
jgi:hypothetical protein